MNTTISSPVPRFSIAIFCLLAVLFSRSTLAMPDLTMPEMTIKNLAIDVVKGFKAEGELRGARLGIRPMEFHWDDHPLLGQFSVYFELSGNSWEYQEDDTKDTAAAIAFSPVFSKQVAEIANRPVGLEFGIGLSYLTATKFAGRNLGMKFQFEDRIGITYALDHQQQQVLALRYLHYSNAGLHDRNSGLDFVNLSYAYRF